MPGFCRYFLWLLLGLIFTYEVKSQGFSEDPVVFGQQASQILRLRDTEAYIKVAYDFESAWNGKFQQAHKEKLMEIASGMRARGYVIRPHFEHLFAYLSNAVVHEGVKADQLHNILDINLKSLKTLNKEQYTDFLYTMSLFFGQRQLYRTRNLYVEGKTDNYSFELIGDVPVDEPEPAPVVEEEADDGLLTEEDIQEEINETSTQDDWSDDGWGDDDGWGNDDWGSTDDDWGSSWDQGDSWGASEDTWDNEEEEEQPALPEYVPTSRNYVTEVKTKYAHPLLEGPVIHMEEMELKLITPYDSFSIRKVEGSHLLKDRRFVGTGGLVTWPGQNTNTRGVEVSLDSFTVRTDRGSFWTPNASAKFPGWFDGETDGAFYYKSIRRGSRQLSSYPRFISFENDITASISDKITYKGGLSLQGDEIYGESISRKKGIITFLDGGGRTATFRSRKFHFEDSAITAESTSFTIKIRDDSIHHPDVNLKFDRSTGKITLYKNDDSEVTPFISSYHGVTINTELIEWYTEGDSITFETLMGKDLVPTTFESLEYFNPYRYSKLTNNVFGFHPITAFVYFARKYYTEQFFVDDFVNETKAHRAMVQGAAQMLDDYGFANFNRETGRVLLLEKAFHFYDSKAGKKDFDNVMIPSIYSGKYNASMHLDSMDMNVNGVKRFFVTTDFGVEIKPKEGQLSIGENRVVTFDGDISAGEFDYSGKEFTFDYSGFLINMPQIDSIAIKLETPDSVESDEGASPLANNLTNTSGTLYLDKPGNKSGREEYGSYPNFASESDAIVYFDGQEILDGAYDKSVFFVIPPLELDSIEKDRGESLFFPGTFNSGGIFPIFEDTLAIMSDRSLGFVHNIPNEGYNLYGTPARTYKTITLDNNGMMGTGEIDFLNTKILSEDFIYYPDSVTADGYGGSIKPGNVGVASFPQAELGEFRMYWLPRKDSMYLKTVGSPFSFYNGTADLTGEANITQKGVYGSGTMLTRGSEAKSNEFAFKELSYSARHADFKVLTDNPNKPAMAGEDVKLDFDLNTNTADITPEKIGDDALSFPFAQMKTSIINAKWDLEDSIITMTKPPNVPIENSYFYSTREDLDSLAFNGSKAVYNIQTYELNIQGIPYIEVADGRVIPDNNETTILENSNLQTFTNAGLEFNYPNATHKLYNGTIDVKSRTQFSGTAIYLLPVFNDTVEIEMKNFFQYEREVVDEGVGLFKKKEKSDRPAKYTVADGKILDQDNLLIAPGFLYKGSVNLKVYKQALELVGYVKPDFKSKPGLNNWIFYTRSEDETEIRIDVDEAKYENGEKLVAGIHYDINGDLYATMVEQRLTPGDLDFFKPKGILRYEPTERDYIIEEKKKSTGEFYSGDTYIYNDSSMDLEYEGEVSFFQEGATKVFVESSVVGSGNMKEGTFNIDALLALDLNLPKEALQIMAEDVVDIATRLGNPPANDLQLSTMIKIANFAGEEETREYETETLKDYMPVKDISPAFDRSIVITGVKMDWSKEFKGWYNTTKLDLSNILDTDVNVKVDGFVEFKKDETGSDIMNLFIQVAPGTWYYFNYQQNAILTYSSNKEFNSVISDKSNFGEAKPEELVLIGGDENETLSFLNEFRKNYYGIEEPYNLVYPDDPSLQDESFETIEKDDDDGFGF